MEPIWGRCLTLGINVVLDSGLWSRSERDRVRALVVTHGGTPMLYRLDCPEQDAWRRVELRNAQLDGGLYIAPATFTALRSRFEPLDADEARVEIAG